MTIETDADGAVLADEVEVGGIKMLTLKDKKGRVWSVPADDDNVDMNEYGLRNILSIPKPEPDFYYQFVGDERMSEYLSADFAPVEPEEVGLPPRHEQPVTSARGGQTMVVSSQYHKVGNMTLVKIPMIVAKRMLRAKKLKADEAKNTIMVPRHMGQAVRQISDTEVEISGANRQVVTGPSVVTPSSFKEYPDQVGQKEKETE